MTEQDQTTAADQDRATDSDPAQTTVAVQVDPAGDDQEVLIDATVAGQENDPQPAGPDGADPEQ
jgi:hypothetical protein